MQLLAKVKQSLYENDPSKINLKERSDSQPKTLRMPSEARAEVAEIKEALKAYNSFKEESKFLGKRNRLISHGWRHGITGQDDADSQEASMFYQSFKLQKEAAQEQKDMINKRRNKCKCIFLYNMTYIASIGSRYGNK